jgi:hypothetical protein
MKAMKSHEYHVMMQAISHYECAILWQNVTEWQLFSCPMFLNNYVPKLWI